LGALAVKMIERLGELGYTDQTPQAGTKTAGVVGADEKTAERLEAVRGWPEAKRQGARRRDYCAQYSIDESTLTKWRAALKKQGYDVPDFA
jgi:transposase-like protein